ncbi:MAG: ATP-binding protein, partial [Flavobacteriales bacterium]|nr:ATP-binding protein [Flavobacteriales bacterium]
NAGGSGLGLSIVKHIIEAHEQSISVRSTPNTGSTFSFTMKKA